MHDSTKNQQTIEINHHQQQNGQLLFFAFKNIFSVKDMFESTLPKSMKLLPWVTLYKYTKVEIYQ